MYPTKFFLMFSFAGHSVYKGFPYQRLRETKRRGQLEKDFDFGRKRDKFEIEGKSKKRKIFEIEDGRKREMFEIEGSRDKNMFKIEGRRKKRCLSLLYFATRICLLLYIFKKSYLSICL